MRQPASAAHRTEAGREMEKRAQKHPGILALLRLGRELIAGDQRPQELLRFFI
jgi:hypothetical protein